ncbi:MAG: hypothetical protein MJK18_07525 [Bdellovibrionales bacterium]|nr:hypothetical protein [Bdellovibrionales bacterium]
MGYFSGIATLTSFFAKACEGTSCRILDTRKTIPLYREFSKRAVAHGGGVNHRMNLSDGILIKENHITVAGSLETTVLNSRERFPDDFIEVETKNLQEVQKAVDLKVNRIMLDNMSLDETAKALEIIPNEIEVEASGNMTLDRIPDVAQLGVDFISVGALTHSAPTADISLIFDWN